MVFRVCFISTAQNARWFYVWNIIEIQSENTAQVWKKALSKLYDQARQLLLNQKNRQSVVGPILCGVTLNVFFPDP